MNTFQKITAVIAVTTLVSCNNQTSNVKSLETSVDSVSYAIGLNMANQLKTGFPEVNGTLFVQGYNNGKDSVNILIEEKDIQRVISTYFQKKQQEALKEQQAKGAENKVAGEAFLAENKNKKGVKTTASGLQYMVIKEGTGKKPAPDSTVKLHYHGTTIEGKVFDSSVDRGEPYTLKANQFVPGFSEGLQLMKAGAKYKFFIPQELAYGASARSAAIAPYSTLIFEVELLEVQ